VVNANRFRVIDASDGHPIAGVDAVGISDFPWGMFSRDHTPEFATSDCAGLVQFNGMGEHELTLEKDGYERCAVVADWPGYRLRGTLVNLHPFPWEDERTAVILLQPRRASLALRAPP
jgi:hypothetical protein